MDMLVCLVAFIISAAITRFLISYTTKQGILDIPNHRSSHKRPTPRGGGVSIVVTFIAFVILMTATTNTNKVLIYSLLFCSAVIAGIGWIDDRYSLSAKLRLGIHTLSAGLFLFFNFSDEPLVLLIFFLGAITWMINLYNFMDGIDGIASIEAIFICFSYLFLLKTSNGLTEYRFLEWILIGSVAGFYIFNHPPAKIFMGDVSSGFLGFIFAALATYFHFKGLISIWVSAILMGTFVADASYTLVLRALRRAPLFKAHRNHAYQIATQNGFSHLQVDALLLTINLVILSPLAYVAHTYKNFQIEMCLLAYIILFFSWLFFRTLKSKSMRAAS